MKEIKPFSFDLTEEEIERFKEGAARVLRSGRLILGDYTKEFERAFASYVGVKHAISVNSGSSALEFLLRLKKIENKTVLVPTNTNFATVAAVLRAEGQVRHLDMDERTFAPSLDMVKEGAEGEPRLAGVLWVHIGGVVSAEFPAVVEHCRKRGLFVLEDAAHAHGSQLGGVMSGNLADGAAFSFFPTKVMTTCEGGMITTNDDEEDYLARSFRNQGKRGMDFGGLHTDFGNSSRITELGALLGLIQLKRLPENLEKRWAAYKAITRRLEKAGLPFVSAGHMEMASNYKLIVLVPEGRPVREVTKGLIADGIIPGGTVYEIPCHQQPVFAGICPGRSYPRAEKWCPRHICPPLTASMTEEDADRVGESLVKHLGK